MSSSGEEEAANVIREDTGIQAALLNLLVTEVENAREINYTHADTYGGKFEKLSVYNACKGKARLAYERLVHMTEGAFGSADDFDAMFSWEEQWGKPIKRRSPTNAPPTKRRSGRRR